MTPFLLAEWVKAMRAGGVRELRFDSTHIVLEAVSDDMPEAKPEDVKEVEPEKEDIDGLTHSQQKLFYGSAGG